MRLHVQMFAPAQHQYFTVSALRAALSPASDHETRCAVVAIRNAPISIIRLYSLLGLCRNCKEAWENRDPGLRRLFLAHFARADMHSSTSSTCSLNSCFPLPRSRAHPSCLAPVSGFSAVHPGRPAQPSPGWQRCVFCDLSPLESMLETSGGKLNVVKMLQVPWPPECPQDVCPCCFAPYCVLVWLRIFAQRLQHLRGGTRTAGRGDCRPWRYRALGPRSHGHQAAQAAGLGQAFGARTSQKETRSLYLQAADTSWAPLDLESSTGDW